MLATFKEIGVNMLYKMHLLHQHLDQLAQQLPTESDEQGERYHQTALPFEIRNRGKKSPDAILAEICWWYKSTFEEEENEEKEEEGEDKDEIPEYQLDEFIDFSDDDDDDQDIRESSDVNPQPPAKQRLSK
ncbi:nucleolin-like [Eurosta solidaginis]|uniref:nucleolin-like n=1 Tax=Eurosta solidaginis TaxID=178769 RepID=UPI003530C246